MTPSSLFAVSQLLPLPFWLLLAVAPRSRLSRWLGVGFLVLTALTYGAALLAAPAGGSTFEQLRAFFGSEWGMVTVWLHALALDFLAGSWIAWDAARLGVGRLVVAPILALTLFFGPLGVLAWLVLRAALRRRVLPFDE